MKRGVFASFLILACWIFGACNKQDHQPHGTNIVEEANLLAIYEREGYDEVFIVNPEGEEVAHYILIPQDAETEYDIPDGAIEIRVPVQNAVIDSEVYAGALEELGATELIGGMFDANYVTSPTLAEKIKSGKIKNLGPATSPNTEKILAGEPEAILLSYFPGMQTEGLEKTGIPIIKMFDLQEDNPLGRAEWIKFIGRLAGKDEMADEIFSRVKDEYSGIILESGTAQRPKVLTEIMYEGNWNVAGGNSYHANLIKDAGGNYFKSDDNSASTLVLTPEQILAAGGDSDKWIIRYFGNGNELNKILESDPVYKEIKAYQEGEIYFSDTSQSGLFREFPFHPELLLKDYKEIFNSSQPEGLRYFRKLDPNQ